MLVESVRGAVEAGIESVVALPEVGPLVGQLQAVGARVVIIDMLVLRKALMKPRGWPRLLRDGLRGLGTTWRLLGSVAPDYVYVSTVTLPEWPIVARARRIPVISHLHEAEHSGNRVVNAALYLPHAAARVILVNSRFSLETLVESLPSLSKRARILYNGVAAPAEPPPPRARLDGPLRLLYVGRLSPRKGPDVVVEGAALLIERGIAVEVSLLGSVFPGYEWFVGELEEQVRARGLSTNVRFLDFNPDIWGEVAAADVLVVPSRIDEPFGNTAVEGLLALRPVIASDTSGLREAAGGYPTAWLVPPNDPAALADRLEFIAEHWSAIVPNVAASRSRAYARHSVFVYRAAVAAAIGALPSRTFRVGGHRSSSTVDLE